MQIESSAPTLIRSSRDSPGSENPSFPSEAREVETPTDSGRRCAGLQLQPGSLEAVEDLHDLADSGCIKPK